MNPPPDGKRLPYTAYGRLQLQERHKREALLNVPIHNYLFCRNPLSSQNLGMELIPKMDFREKKFLSKYQNLKKVWYIYTAHFLLAVFMKK